MSRVEIALFLVALAVGVLAVTAVASRLDIPAPLLLIAVGVATSYLPGVPEIRLEPDVVLIGLLPPLLYAAAIQTSLVDFNANRRSILLLSIGLVIFTTIGIGIVVHAILPGISWGASLAIGAVVAPPDAVAATTIGRRIGLPRRIVTILEGESLLNDATALVSLRTAVAGPGPDRSGVVGGGSAPQQPFRFVVHRLGLGSVGGTSRILGFGSTPSPNGAGRLRANHRFRGDRSASLRLWLPLRDQSGGRRQCPGAPQCPA